MHFWGVFQTLANEDDRALAVLACQTDTLLGPQVRAAGTRRNDEHALLACLRPCLNMMLHHVTFMNAASPSNTRMFNGLLWQDKTSPART